MRLGYGLGRVGMFVGILNNMKDGKLCGRMEKM